MAKVHPDAAVVALPGAPPAAGRAQQPGGAGAGADEGPVATVLTVWRKSLLFNCDGFTVFDTATGDLAFRVDCYGSSSGRRRRRRLRAKDDVVLMGPAGAPLLTLRRKRLISLAEHWVIYDGDGSDDTAEPLLSVRRCHVGFLHAHASSSKQQIKALAHVTPLSSSSPAYVVEGSYAQRSVAVRDVGCGAGEAAAVVAEVRRKESPVGDEVFRLVVPDPSRLGATLAVGIVIALDEMFGGPGGGGGAGAARSLLPRSWSL